MCVSTLVLELELLGYVPLILFQIAPSVYTYSILDPLLYRFCSAICRLNTNPGISPRRLCSPLSPAVCECVSVSSCVNALTPD